MSGLLQRLAAQAMGKMNTVRPLSRSRYAAPFTPENITGLDQHPSNFVESIQPHEQFHLDQRDEKKGGAAVHTQPANSHTENAIQPHVEISSALLKSAASPPVTELIMTSLSSPPQRTRSANEKAVTEFSAEPEHIETDGAIDSPATHAAHSVHHVRLTESDTAPSLLPLTKPAQVAAENTPGIMQRGNADRFMQASQTQERREETTEVHVHIGRIEVRATMTAAPARKTPARSPMMSLDDYLEQRNGRSR
ncbi:hypothetical protein [Nitrosomonas sp.]|uniref:hypothetical protein n=1 Tax=Nitrosomonas sp. TaxID=42353 RepID=UPI0037CA87CB